MTIHGVIVKDVDIAAKEKGNFIKVLESSKSFKKTEQIALSVTFPRIIKAFHYHKKQSDFWYVISGNARAVLHDLRKDSPTYRQTQQVFMGESFKPVSLYIPPGVAHGYQVLGNKDLLILYVLDQTYNPKDEFRIPYDDKDIGFNWIIKHG